MTPISVAQKRVIPLSYGSTLTIPRFYEKYNFFYLGYYVSSHGLLTILLNYSLVLYKRLVFTKAYYKRITFNMIYELVFGTYYKKTPSGKSSNFDTNIILELNQWR